jgi:hypothetical protein
MNMDTERLAMTQLVPSVIRPWAALGTGVLTSETLQQLMENHVPYIKIPGFASVAGCDALVNCVINEAFGHYRDVEPRIGRMGCTVFEYDAIGKQHYFAASRLAAEARDRLFLGTFDPLGMMMRLLSRNTGRRTTIAENGVGQSYYAGLIRRIERGTKLHVDYAPAEQKGWEICDVKHQLTWNLYLKVDGCRSGHTTIYCRQWRPEDDRFKEGSYGFNPEVVRGSEHVTFQPAVGEVILFNTKNYHEVGPSLGDRITVTSAIGETPQGDLILWS